VNIPTRYDAKLTGRLTGHLLECAYKLSEPEIGTLVGTRRMKVPFCILVYLAVLVYNVVIGTFSTDHRPKAIYGYNKL